MSQPSMLVRATPAVFVLIWSTGFVVARYGMPHAQPLSFLSLRYALSALAFALWLLLGRIQQFRTRLGNRPEHFLLLDAGELGRLDHVIQEIVASL